MQYAVDLRNAVNNRSKQSIDNKHNDKEIKGEYYFAWYRTCAAMDRLEDTIRYLNSIELGKNQNSRSAFDFYDFINNAYVVIDCIKTIGKIFRVDNKLVEEIENSTSVFGTRLSEKCTDEKYFEYIRSLCSVHPICTNRQPVFLNDNSTYHCCPFVTWRKDWGGDDTGADLFAIIYTSNGDENFHGIYVSQFEQYLTKWIDFIAKIIEAKNNYADQEYERLRSEHVKELCEFNNDIVRYLAYLKEEYCKRFNYDAGDQFDICTNFFTVELSDPQNAPALEKYKNAILYSLNFLRNALQNMSFEGYENSGLKHPGKYRGMTLFDILYSPSTHNSAFSEYSYILGKIPYLDYFGNYSEFDKMYAQTLLEEMKEVINRYVRFTNCEPDIEKAVLIKLALYLEALTRRDVLNKNIPNTQKYRIQILSDEEFDFLLPEDENQSDKDGIKKLRLLLRELGIDNV